MPTTIWYQVCPVCRRRYPCKSVLRGGRGDYAPIDYPLQTAVSVGARGFVVTDYIGWSRLANLPRDAAEALSIFLGRVAATYRLAKALGLVPSVDYAEAYEGHDGRHRERLSFGGSQPMPT